MMRDGVNLPWLVIKDANENVIESDQMSGNESAQRRRLETAVNIRREHGHTIEKIGEWKYRATSPTGDVVTIARTLGPP